MKTLILSLLYFLSGLAFIILKYIPGPVPEFVVKARIEPLLILILLVNLEPGKQVTHWLLFLSLLFAWAGDVLLELPNAFSLTRLHETFFMAGLAGFLITQLLFFTLFSLAPVRKSGWRLFPVMLLPVCLYGAGLLWIMMDDLGNLRVPVIVYTVVILAMIAAAINRYKKVNERSYFLVLAGALLFLLSDSLLAVNKFSFPFRGSSPLIMARRTPLPLRRTVTRFPSSFGGPVSPRARTSML